MPESGQRYLQGGADYFWNWEEGGEVLALRGGATIAYRAYVGEVLEFLAPQGLPPFGTVLLALLATNPQGTEHISYTFQRVEAQLHSTHGHRVLLPPARAFLERLAQLPRPYREGRNRYLLLQAIFAQVHNALSVSNGRSIANTFFEASAAEAERPPDAGFPRAIFYKDFRAIGLLNRRFPDERSIIDAITALPKADVEIPPAPGPEGKPKDFIDELLGEPQTFAVAALVRRLWSGLQIPHHYSQPSQQPVGGVSDITNKGPFDRLLITEFAYDDDQFAMRLANNEALFINREVPPQHNERERILLIDMSLRSWGTPKVLAYALLLAIARHPKTDIPCRAFAVGKTFRAVEFNSVAGLIDALQLLDPCADPAEGLEAFFRSGELHRNSELFFICAREAAAQPAVHKAVQDHYTRFQYWLHTDAEGAVDLYRRQQGTRRLLQQLRLPLKELWKDGAPKRLVTPQPVSAPEKPIYPVRFPKPQRWRYLYRFANEEFLVVTRNGSVLVDDPAETAGRHSKGMQLMLERLPGELQPLGAGRDTRGAHLLLTYQRAQKKIVLFQLEKGGHRVAHIEDRLFSRVWNSIFYKDRFYISGGPYPYLYFSIGWGEPVCRREEKLPEHLATQLLRHREVQPTVRARQRMAERAVPVHHTYAPQENFLRRPRLVWINSEGGLMFNDIELSMSQGYKGSCWVGLAYRPNTTTLRAAEVATQVKRQVFRFADGSTVTIHPDGIAILHSSNEAIPAIYLPTLIGNWLALTAGGSWTGDLGLAAPDLRYLDTPAFWQRYIEPFIKHIVAHGTPDKAR